MNSYLLVFLILAAAVASLTCVEVPASKVAPLLDEVTAGAQETSSIRTEGANSPEARVVKLVPAYLYGWGVIDLPLYLNIHSAIKAAEKMMINLKHIILGPFSKRSAGTTTTRTGRLLEVYPDAVGFEEDFIVMEELFFPNSTAALPSKTPRQLYQDILAVDPKIYMKAVAELLDGLVEESGTSPQMRTNDENSSSSFEPQQHWFGLVLKFVWDITRIWANKDLRHRAGVEGSYKPGVQTGNKFVGPRNVNIESEFIQYNSNENEHVDLGNQSAKFNHRQRRDLTSTTNFEKKTEDFKPEQQKDYLSKDKKNEYKLSLLSQSLTNTNGYWVFEHGINVHIPRDLHKYSVLNNPGDLSVSCNSRDCDFGVFSLTISESNKRVLNATFANGVQFFLLETLLRGFSTTPTSASILY